MIDPLRAPAVKLAELQAKLLLEYDGDAAYTIREFRTLARHEAGHAIVKEALGLTPAGVRLCDVGAGTEVCLHGYTYGGPDGAPRAKNWSSSRPAKLENVS